MRPGGMVSIRFAVSAVVALTIAGGVCLRAAHAGGPPGADAAPGATEPVAPAPGDAPPTLPAKVPPAKAAGVTGATTTLHVPAGDGPSVPVTLATTPATKLQAAARGSQAVEPHRGPFAPLAVLAPFSQLLHHPRPPVPPRALAPTVMRGPAIPAAGGSRRDESVQRVTMGGTWATSAKTTAYPEEVVLRAMATRQPEFTRCWDKAQLSDTAPSSNKVNLHIELDGAGKITAVSAATDSPKLAACLAVHARQLSFPSPGGKPAIVDVPLMFR